MSDMPWTDAQRLEALMELPWTIHVETDDTDGSYVAHVAEVPDAIATGATLRDLARDLYESLAASLEVRLHNDDAIPLPAGHTVPWTTGPYQPRRAHIDLIIGQQRTTSAIDVRWAVA